MKIERNMNHVSVYQYISQHNTKQQELKKRSWKN